MSGTLKEQLVKMTHVMFQEYWTKFDEIMIGGSNQSWKSKSALLLKHKISANTSHFYNGLPFIDNLFNNFEKLSTFAEYCQLCISQTLFFWISNFEDICVWMTKSWVLKSPVSCVPAGWQCEHLCAGQTAIFLWPSK